MGSTDIPGDPLGLQALATQLGAAGDNVESVSSQVAANGLPGWEGAGGDAFRRSLDRFPGELHGVSQSLGNAAAHVSRFASQLEQFQHTAIQQAEQLAQNERAENEARARQAAAQTKLDGAHLTQSLAHDPVSAQTARQVVMAAEDGLRAAGDGLASVLDEGARLLAAAAANSAAYEQAVQDCISGLGDVVAGILAFLSGATMRVQKIAGHVYAISWFGKVEQDARHEAKRIGRDAGNVARDVHHVVTHIEHGVEKMAHDVAHVAGGALHYVENAGYKTGGDLYDLFTHRTLANALAVLDDVATDATIVGAGILVVLGGAEVVGAVGALSAGVGLDGMGALGASVAADTGVDGLGLATLVDAPGVEMGLGALQTIGRVTTFAGDVDAANTEVKIASNVVDVIDGRESIEQASKPIADGLVTLGTDELEDAIPEGRPILSGIVGATAPYVDGRVMPVVDRGIESLDGQIPEIVQAGTTSPSLAPVRALVTPDTALLHFVVGTSGALVQ